MQPLLKTKLRPPRILDNLVWRQRLTRRLNDHTEFTLTLISAPAGYGKTTLLASWLAQSAAPIAWLSLGELDDEPARFLGYLLGSLQQVWPTLGRAATALLDASPSGAMQTTCTLLLNDAADMPQPITLVLDDYHLIQSDEIHAAVSFLLTHAPPNLHLVISSRSQPPWSLSWLRAKGKLLEITSVDLCFTTQEGSDFWSAPCS